MTDELKPCPFCRASVRTKPMPQGFLMFICNGCGACVSFVPKGAIGSNDPAEFTDAEAIAAWNRRAP